MQTRHLVSNHGAQQVNPIDRWDLPFFLALLEYALVGLFFSLRVDQHSVGSDQRPSLWTLLVAHTPTPTHLEADHLAKLIYPNLYG